MKDKKIMAIIAGSAAVAGVAATIVGVKSIKSLKKCCENDAFENDTEISIEGYSEESKEKINSINNKIDELNDELNERQLKFEAELEAKRDEILKLKEEVIAEEEKLRQSIIDAKQVELEGAASIDEENENSEEVVEEKEATVE